jgi:hypothetical protein
MWLDILCLCLCSLLRGGCGCRILREHLVVGCGSMYFVSCCDIVYCSCDVGSCYVVKCCFYLNICCTSLVVG